MEKKCIGFNMGDISRYRSEIFGVTIIWIMLLHGVIMDKVIVWEPVEWLYVILKHGNVGVDIFLFLSGVGLYFSFVKDNNIENYMRKRFARVLLPYVIIGGTYFVYADIIVKKMPLAFLKDFSLMSFLFKGNKLIWYVFVILFCYIIFPYLYSLFYETNGAYKKTALRNFVLITGIIILLTFVLQSEYKEVYSYIEIALTRLPVFICGCVCARGIKCKKEISVWWLLLAFVVVITSYPIFVRNIFVGIYQRYYYCILGIALVMVFAFVFSVIKNQIIHKLSCWFGAISFELYLAHILLRNLLLKSRWYTEPVMPKYVILLILAVVIAKYVSVLTEGLQKPTVSCEKSSLNTLAVTGKKRRIVWIDQYRAIAFYFVILGHLPIVLQPHDIFGGETNALRILIYSFHMPVFFFLSGITFKKEKVLQNGLGVYIRGVVQRLLIPYFWMNFMLLPLWVFTFKVLSHKPNPVGSILFGIFYANPNQYGTPQGALWFLLTLFMALIVYAVIVKGSGGNYVKMLPAMLALFALGYMTREIDVPWHLNGIPTSVVFIFAGNVFFDLYQQGKCKKLLRFNILSLLVAAVAFLLWFYIGLQNGKVSMIANVYGSGKRGYLLFYLGAFLAIYVLLYIVEKIPYIKILSYIGQNTLLYIGIHVPIRNLFQIWIPDLMQKTGFLLIFSIILYFMMVPCSMFMNKVFPYVCGQSYVETKCTKIGKPIMVCIALTVPLYLLLKKYHFINVREVSGVVIFCLLVVILGIVVSAVIDHVFPIVFGKPRKR